MKKPTNGKVKIEKGVPFLRHHSRLYDELPLDKMEVGDSIFTAQPRGSLSSSLKYHGLKLQRRFKTQMSTENGVEGFRVWRTE